MNPVPQVYPGQSFASRDLTDNYQYRPAYPSSLFDKLISISPELNHVLDLGCGPGKIAIGLSSAFSQVTAVDASAEMIQLGIRLQGSSTNIDWVHGLGESVEMGDESFDLIVAAASIHWMDHAVLFPKLRSLAASDHVFAVINGDDAFEPPWQEAWGQFLAKWLWELKGETYEPENDESSFANYMNRYREWIDVQGHMTFEQMTCQHIDEFIKCQHSRDTFAPAKLGSRMPEFDAELQELLQPHTQKNLLEFCVRTDVEWGTIKNTTS